MQSEEAEEIAGLLRTPLDAFTQTRTERVRALRQEGKRDLAQRLAALRKPSLVLWALNQAGVVARDELDQLREAAAQLRTTQERVLQGDRRAAQDMQRALQEQRAAVDVLARRLGMTLTAAGHAASDETLRRLSEDLRTLSAADEDTWRALQASTLQQEPEAASFPMMDVEAPQRVVEEHADRETQAHRKKVQAAEADVRRAEELVQTTREHEELARQRHEEAKQALHAARELLAGLQRNATDNGTR